LGPEMMPWFVTDGELRWLLALDQLVAHLVEH
jgi:hypothetical protein